MTGMRLQTTLTVLLVLLVPSGIRGNKAAGTSQTEPEFAEPIQNITVPAGRKVTLACVVDNLNNYRVAWMFVEKFTLLTLAKSVITHNSRFKVTHNGHRTWHLHIHDVQERDRGAYMCQINTSPMKSQIGYLNVVVPPKIDEENTSSDTEVREGGEAALKCVAKGTPEPEITWRREDDQEIAFGREKVPSVKGTWLNITKVSRLHMSAYLCIASNGVLPSVSKRIILEVSFAPMIWIPNQLVGASVDTDVTLDCNLESHPKSVTYWTRNTDTIIHQNSKYSVVTVQHAMYKVQMQLMIRRLKPEDFGEYHCVAKNSLGETEGTIKLYAVVTTKPQDLSEASRDQRPSYTPAVVKIGDLQLHGSSTHLKSSVLSTSLLLVIGFVSALS
ncbi:lachesin-like isoform X3 [Dermacentor andersoni]|uniref:lachesin-like isoform X3 n=1 Tax=Dermacentor andersoni TaxID=34620 RepID=UPI002415B62D|nr:lachesin-like isoform X3 [Dermacentor andersoni]